ncbi:MAG: uncharacterized protein A8A55_3567, partial [Amphiamblys sp. WSBS2006]
KSKAFELEEAIDYMSPDVLFLQETLEKEELKLCGFKTLHRKAEDGPGKQGVGIAVHQDFSLSELGGESPYFCLGDVKGQFGRLAVGSVYIPCTAQTETMELLGKEMRRLIVSKERILLGGDWNMSRKELERESKKWLLETKIVDSSGSELSRHGYS